MNKIIIAPSVLSANYINLEKDLLKFQKHNIKWLHYDVMDYHFVPNLTFGPKILEDINKIFDFKIDAHLMVKINDFTIKDYLAPFIKAGVNQITMHIESLSKPQINELKEVCFKNGILFSLAVNPKTRIDEIEEFLPYLNNVLVMSVEPGFGGQAFMPIALKKIKKLVEIRSKNNFNYKIEVDGGINEQTYKLVQEAGVDMIVAGNYLFNCDDLEKRIKLLENK